MIRSIDGNNVVIDWVTTIAKAREIISENLQNNLISAMNRWDKIVYNLNSYTTENHIFDKDTFLKIFNFISKDTNDEGMMDKYCVLFRYLWNFKLFRGLDNEIISTIIKKINDDLNNENWWTEKNYELKVELVKAILENMESFDNNNTTIKYEVILDNSRDENILITIWWEKIPVLYYRDLPYTFREFYLEKILSRDVVDAISNKEAIFYKKVINKNFLNRINSIKKYNSPEIQLKHLNYLQIMINNYYTSVAENFNIKLDVTDVNSTDVDELISLIRQDLEIKISSILEGEIPVTDKRLILAGLPDRIEFFTY